MRAWLLVVACACGRISFDARSDANGDAAGDGPVARCQFRDVETGRDHTCAIDGNGDLFCWGRNDRGQVSGSSSSPKTLPTSMTLPASPIELAVGRDFTCARVTGDDVYCWGDNANGQLGVGTTTQRSGPVKVDLGTDTALAIRAGAVHACVIRASDRSVACWGQNQRFAVGTPIVDAIVPTPTVLTGTQGTQQLSLGHRHSCAILATGETTCWGRGEMGQLADMTTTSRPPGVSTAIAPLRAIAAGGRHTCGIDMTGAALCWGRNVSGELGRGTFDFADHPDPTPVASDVIAIETGVGGVCAVRGSGTLACWGDVDPADGTSTLHYSPFDTPFTDVAQIAMRFYHACMIRESGELLCWGANAHGQLGRGTRAVQPTPVATTLGASSQLSVGGFHACAVSGGDVYCWGSNFGGQLGNGTRNDSRSPQLVATGLSTIAGISTGRAHSCAYGLGVVACWGENRSRQLGANATGPIVANPVLVPGFAGIANLVSGGDTSCLIDTGQVKCWGENGSGQLGNSSNADSATAVTVMNIAGATALCAGSQHVCAIDGTAVKCWGENGDGQLGINSQTNASVPATVAFANPAAIACGRGHTCALDTMGNVSCWGRNLSGELGVGDYTSPRLVPTPVTLPGPAATIVAGGYTTCATLTTGAVYCWGGGERGELGNGTFGSAESPRASPALDGATTISLGDLGGCALEGSTVSCFGDGTLNGDGDESGAVPMSPSFTCAQ